MSTDIAIIRNLSHLIKYDISIRTGSTIDISSLRETNRFLLQIASEENDNVKDIEQVAIVDENQNVIRLYLSSANLDYFPREILNLRNLEVLCLFRNNIQEIPPDISLLTKLQVIFIKENPITSIPKEIIDLRNLKELVVDQKDLVSPPYEIIDQGIESIRSYFSQLEKAEGKTNYLFEAKLLIIGDGGTGKTSFKRKLMDVNAEMPKDKDTTLGIDVEKWGFSTTHPNSAKPEDVNFNVNIWDFGGQKVYRGTHQIFFTDKSFYVLVADTREQGTDFSYWLNTVMQLAGDESGILILLNKKHGHALKFDERGYRGYFGKIIKEVFEIDLQNDKTKISDLQDTMKFYLKRLPGIGDPLPPSWVQIREDLLKETGHFITFERFREICADYEITDSNVIRTLSGYFSRIGVFTHYIDDPVLSERIYLDSNWLVNTVYEVLDNERVKEKKGRLTESDIKEIWRRQELDFEINRLTQLMHNFGLMYRIPSSKDYVAPEHLPTDQPYDHWKYEGLPDILYFIYEFDKYMPKGLMSRLIVSLNRYIKDHELVWHRGFNIELQGTHAEIIETYGATNTFRIRIVGANKIELLSIIRERFIDVLKPFKNLNYKQLVPCPCPECTKLPEPGFHDYDKLLNLREKGKTGSQCPEGEIVEISELLRIIEFTKKTVEQEDTKPSEATSLKTIDLFLASSSELTDDRQQVEIWVNRENKKLVNNGYFLKLNLWEDFLDAMSETRLQDEYNKVVAQSDIVICLFATKVGEFTEEEFEVAYSSFKKKGKPIYIYTYFKDVQVNTSDMSIVTDLVSLRDFKEKISKLGHFYTIYKSVEDLTGKLKNQLDKIFEKIR